MNRPSSDVLLLALIPLDNRRMLERASASDVSGLRHWFCASRWQRPESNIACFLVPAYCN